MGVPYSLAKLFSRYEALIQLQGQLAGVETANLVLPI